MTKHRLANGIFLLRFETQYALASTFLRFQEHYESSRFRNRVFTLEQFMDWYAKQFGAFTYYEDWAGFNIPSTALAAFSGGEFDPLLRKEQQLLALFRNERRPFYIIGIAAEADLTHELAHALYFTRPAYKQAVRSAMRGYDTSAFAKRLAAMGYHRSVLADEVHAYLVSAPTTRGLIPRRLLPLRKQLSAIYQRHAADLKGR